MDNPTCMNTALTGNIRFDLFGQNNIILVYWHEFKHLNRDIRNNHDQYVSKET